MSTTKNNENCSDDDDDDDQEDYICYIKRTGKYKNGVLEGHCMFRDCCLCNHYVEINDNEDLFEDYEQEYRYYGEGVWDLK